MRGPATPRMTGWRGRGSLQSMQAEQCRIVAARGARRAGRQEYTQAREAAKRRSACSHAKAPICCSPTSRRPRRRSRASVRQWLARAVRAPRDPAWVADGFVSERWAPVSPVTGKLDAFEWRAPVERLGQLIEHEDAPAAAPVVAAPVDYRNRPGPSAPGESPRIARRRISSTAEEPAGAADAAAPHARAAGRGPDSGGSRQSTSVPTWSAAPLVPDDPSVVPATRARRQTDRSSTCSERSGSGRCSNAYSPFCGICPPRRARHERPRADDPRVAAAALMYPCHGRRRRAPQDAEWERVQGTADSEAYGLTGDELDDLVSAGEQAERRPSTSTPLPAY